MEESVKKEIARALEDALVERDSLSRTDAYLFAWEILNDYPEVLRDIALEWLETGKAPKKEIDGLSAEMIEEVTGGPFNLSLRILQLYLHYPNKAGVILTSYARKNTR